MNAEWVSEEIQRVTRFKVTDVDPVAPSYGDRMFLPEWVTITVTVSVSADEPEVYGPVWDANVRGMWMLRGGRPGKQEHVERYWSSHRDVPAWLRTLGERCVANLRAEQPAPPAVN